MTDRQNETLLEAAKALLENSRISRSAAGKTQVVVRLEDIQKLEDAITEVDNG